MNRRELLVGVGATAIAAVLPAPTFSLRSLQYNFFVQEYFAKNVWQAQWEEVAEFVLPKGEKTSARPRQAG